MLQSAEAITTVAIVVWYSIFSVGAAICLHKAGRSALKGFIPLVNVVELFRTVGVSGWYALFAFVPAANLMLLVYLALKIAQRFGATTATGLMLAFSGFLLLPFIGLDRWQYRQNDQVDRLTTSPGVHPLPGSSTDIAVEYSIQSNRIRMIVLSVFYIFCLLCIPGALIIGTMAFGGATQRQVDHAGVLGVLFGMTPMTLLIALAGGWILHARRQFRAAVLIAVIPLVNIGAVATAFIWVLTR